MGAPVPSQVMPAGGQVAAAPTRPGPNQDEGLPPVGWHPQGSSLYPARHSVGDLCSALCHPTTAVLVPRDWRLQHSAMPCVSLSCVPGSICVRPWDIVKEPGLGATPRIISSTSAYQQPVLIRPNI